MNRIYFLKNIFMHQISELAEGQQHQRIAPNTINDIYRLYTKQDLSEIKTKLILKQMKESNPNQAVNQVFVIRDIVKMLSLINEHNMYYSNRDDLERNKVY